MDFGGYGGGGGGGYGGGGGGGGVGGGGGHGTETSYSADMSKPTTGTEGSKAGKKKTGFLEDLLKYFEDSEKGREYREAMANEPGYDLKKFAGGFGTQTQYSADASQPSTGLLGNSMSRQKRKARGQLPIYDLIGLLGRG